MPNVKPRTLKGFKDYLPEEQKARQKIINACREVFELYGFLPTDTPALEYADILEDKIGEEEKLIYKFTDRGGREVAMRYDLTVPLARVAAQYQNEIKLPFRRYQIGTVWRADNPQKGRYREFMQADADVIGTESLAADAEVINMYFEIFKRLDLSDFQVDINSRKVFDALVDKIGVSADQEMDIIRAIDKYDKAGEQGVVDYLTEKKVATEAVENIKNYLSIQGLEGLKDFLGQSDLAEQAITELEQIGRYLKSFGASEDMFVFNPRIARGLDYYTGPIFEVFVQGSDIGSLGSGGRYDKLVESFSSKSIPAVGMSVGIDRLLALMIENKLLETVSNSQVLIMNLGEEFTDECLKLLAKLRNENISAQYFYESKDLDKQFKYAEEFSIPYGILLGEDEIKSNQYSLRDLLKREQEMLDFESLLARLK